MQWGDQATPIALLPLTLRTVPLDKTHNEASFLALDRLSPVTHSVANTLKRVVIIVASCIVFKTPMTLIGGIGSGVAVLGTLLYSLAKKQYSTKGSGH
jgi:solute carrier family 35 protein E1